MHRLSQGILFSSRSYNRGKGILALLLVLCQVATNVGVIRAQNATPPPPFARTTANILKGMSVNQKVGQLFMVSFPGTDAGITSDIADLIINYRVGGIQVLAANQNIVNGIDGTRQLAELTNRLQALSGITQTALLVGATPTSTVATTVHELPANMDYIPLFIATFQEGDGAPYSNITQGVTQSPSELAIGATWRIENGGKGRMMQVRGRV